MRVLGIDPGSLATGWGLLGGLPARPRLLDCGVIRLSPRQPLAQRLARLQTELDEVVTRLVPTGAAVETPFHGASARAALQLAHARGVILAVLAARELEVAEYSPATVKKSIVGNGRAAKEQIAAMVERLLGEIEHPSHDVSDALAIALCHVSTLRFRAAVERSAAPAGAGRRRSPPDAR